MSEIRGLPMSELTQRATRQLQETISSQYPTTIYELVRSPDDPAALHLLAAADVDDPDEVGDLVVERVVTLQVAEGIPLHLIPLRSHKRIADARAAVPGRSGQRTMRMRGES